MGPEIKDLTFFIEDPDGSVRPIGTPVEIEFTDYKELVSKPSEPASRKPTRKELKREIKVLKKKLAKEEERSQELNNRLNRTLNYCREMVRFFAGDKKLKDVDQLFNSLVKNR